MESPALWQQFDPRPLPWPDCPKTHSYPHWAAICTAKDYADQTLTIPDVIDAITQDRDLVQLWTGRTPRATAADITAAIDAVDRAGIIDPDRDAALPHDRELDYRTDVQTAQALLRRARLDPRTVRPAVTEWLGIIHGRPTRTLRIWAMIEVPAIAP